MTHRRGLHKACISQQAQETPAQGERDRKYQVDVCEAGDMALVLGSLKIKAPPPPLEVAFPWL